MEMPLVDAVCIIKPEHPASIDPSHVRQDEGEIVSNDIVRYRL